MGMDERRETEREGERERKRERERQIMNSSDWFILETNQQPALSVSPLPVHLTKKGGAYSIEDQPHSTLGYMRSLKQ